MMKIHQAALGLPLLLALGSCSGEVDPSTTAIAASNVSIRVAGFVEAAGIT